MREKGREDCAACIGKRGQEEMRREKGGGEEGKEREEGRGWHSLVAVCRTVPRVVMREKGEKKEERGGKR